MSLKPPKWKDWPASRSEIYSQYSTPIKEKWPEVRLCMTFLTFRVKGGGWGNSCAIKDVWPHNLTLNLSPYSPFLISLPSMAWLFPFTSTVSFGVGEGPQTLEMPAGPAFHSLQDLMSISCLKQLKMEPLTNWEWSGWCNVNYGDWGGTIRAAGWKINRRPLGFRLCDTGGLNTSQITSTHEREKEDSVCVCVCVGEDRLIQSGGLCVCVTEWRWRERHLSRPLCARCVDKVHGLS